MQIIYIRYDSRGHVKTCELCSVVLTRARWTLEDITPYILSLTTPQLNVNALLTKEWRLIIPTANHMPRKL
jgi:hypothetical protein